MQREAKLAIVKIIHTIIWVLFNVVIFYMLYAAIFNKIDYRLWTGFVLFIVEGIILLIFKFSCPLTVWARKYSDSTRHNFDIYLPEWLAKYNKAIYTSILGLIIVITLYQVLK